MTEVVYRPKSTYLLFAFLLRHKEDYRIIQQCNKNQHNARKMQENWIMQLDNIKAV